VDRGTNEPVQRAAVVAGTVLAWVVGVVAAATVAAFFFVSIESYAATALVILGIGIATLPVALLLTLHRRR
jgi:hypothetical protein